MFLALSRMVLTAGASFSVAAFVAAALQAGEIPAGERVTPVFAQNLPHVANERIAATIVDYSASEKSVSHRYGGSIFAYVLSETIRPENSATRPIRIYKAGDSFFEPVGSTHRISENASSTEPGKLLAVFVAADGAPLTTADGHGR